MIKLKGGKNKGRKGRKKEMMSRKGQREGKRNTGKKETQEGMKMIEGKNKGRNERA
jgi:hypothetical protein